LAAAQVAEVDTSSLSADAEGLKGRFSLEALISEVRTERKMQELKWGTRTGADADPEFWLTVVLEEIGEVAEELVGSGTANSELTTQAIALGNRAREILERL
jgi:NTP pyrophosphatase (non-canonical NTP hydrolase)